MVCLEMNRDHAVIFEITKIFNAVYSMNPLKKKNCYVYKCKKKRLGDFLAIQWLGLCTYTTEDIGSIPSRGTKVF